MDAVNENTIFPHMTCLPQTKTEIAFGEILKEKSLTIHRETALESYKQTSDHVEAIIKKSDGSTETVQAKYIIGADGSHSAVRKCTDGWTYDGYAVSTRFAMADVVLEGKDADKFKNGRVSAFSHPKGIYNLWIKSVHVGSLVIYSKKKKTCLHSIFIFGI